MNGPEFFMQHAGYRLLPANEKTDDVVKDTDRLFSIALPLNTGKFLRLSSCWFVVTADWVATSFKTLPEAGFRHDIDRKTAIDLALKAGKPCVLLGLGKRTTTANDIYVTYDPRAARLCEQGKTKTYDATKEKAWTS
jgi:hypothetical protein